MLQHRHHQKGLDFFMIILVVNAGSSSLKYQLIDMENEHVLTKGLCERIGIDGSVLTHKVPGKDNYVVETPMPDHSVAVKLVLDALTDKDHGVIASVEEINAKGEDIQFELQFEDDENDSEKSVNAYNKLKDWGMQILMGTVTTKPCIAVSTETNSDKIFQLTPSASSTDVIGGQPDSDGNVTIQRKDNVFQMCFTDPNQGVASAQYIKEQKLGTKIAIIYNNGDAYSTGIYQKFAAEAKKEGLEIVSTTTFPDDTNSDFSAQLNDAKAKGADLLFLPIYYTPASLILTQANKMGYTPKFFGVDGMDGILDLDGFDASLAEDLMFLTPFTANATDEATQKFVADYKEAFGDTPIQFAADAYDCVYVIKAAAEKEDVTPDKSVSDICDALKKGMTEITYDGLTGKSITWSEDGEPTKEPTVVVVKSGEYQVLQAEDAAE